MKKNLLLSLIAVVFFVSGYSQTNKGTKTKIAAKSEVKATSNSKKVVAHKERPTKETIALRKSHANFLKNNPFKKTYLMSEDVRKAAGLPPNKYYEQEWIATMNPVIGRPTPENLTKIREDLENSRAQALANRVPGDGTDNLWVERGPNNVGGRTKAIIFDPTDATFNTVVCGGISGGLWKNTNISSAASAWTRITTLPENLNVQNITIDPNNSSIWYVGTGESYTGDANGNGIWKTTNAGTSWTRVFGGGTVSTTQNFVYNLNIYAPSNGAVIRGYSTSLASFGSAVADLGGNKTIELVNDGTAPTEDACTALTAGSMTGKIALIRRGSCTFESKVVQAQNAGAVGVIIMNNAAGAGVIPMADDAAVVATIPCVMISKEDGDLLVANLTNLTGNFAAALPGQFSGTAVSGIQFINDIAIKNNGGVSEIYAAVGDSFNSAYINSSNYGLYKSVDGGTNWTGPLSLPSSPSGNKTCPFDLEIAVGGKIWLSTTDSTTFGDGGGKIFVSADNGATWTLKYTVTGGSRTEIEASNTTADVIYVLSEITPVSPATIETTILKTTNGFTTTTVVPLPTSIYSSGPTNPTREYTAGFTGFQAFYDLMIETDPTNDAILYVGGIDLYRSTNSGSAWTQISQWKTNVHSDQHAMTFKPGSPDIALFGCDGGIYYSGSLSATGTPATTRNVGFNVTQFVGVAVSPTGVTGITGDFFTAGAQDNGSNYFPLNKSTTTGVTSGTLTGSVEVQGGDGGIPLFKQNATSSASSYYVTNYVYNDDMNVRNLDGTVKKNLNTSSEGFGQFYPAMALSSADNIVYSDATDGASRLYQVRRYASYLGGPAPTKTLLTNALLTAYPTALSVGKVTPQTLYVGTSNSKLLKVVSASTTAGTWSDITGSGFVGTISDIEFGANDSQIFVTLKNYGTTNIWYTSNGGTNWYSIEGDLPDMPVHTILQNPLNAAEIFIGTELGVWYANTFSPTATATQALAWKQSYNGMSNVKVTDMDIQPNSPTAPTAYNVFAATYGRGVFSGPLTTPLLSTSNNVENSKGAKVYPNPSNGQFNLRIENFTGKVNIQLVDINGRVVYNVDENNFNTEKSISTNSLQAGIYILNVKGDDLNYTEKVIVN